jgi:hypothetical protein
MLGRRAVSVSRALRDIIASFREEGVPLLAVKGYPMPLQSFEVVREIVSHAEAHNRALPVPELGGEETHATAPSETEQTPHTFSS